MEKANCKPRGAVPHFADGGFLGGIKNKLFGPPETMTEKFARKDAELRAKLAGKAAQEPKPTEAAPMPQDNSVKARVDRAEKEALGLKNGGSLQTGKGGHVPGTGKGDKIDAKYEPGEFVVSNDMLKDDPGLRDELSALRTQVLAKKGMTPAQADAKVFKGGAIRAVDGLDEDKFIRPPRAPALLAAQMNPTSAAMVANGRDPLYRQVQAPNFTTSLGAAPANNLIDFKTPPEPIQATTSLGATAPKPAGTVLPTAALPQPSVNPAGVAPPQLGTAPAASPATGAVRRGSAFEVNMPKMESTGAKMLDVAKNSLGPAAVVATAIPGQLRVADVASNPNSTKLDVGAQQGEEMARWGGGGIGAAIGGTLGLAGGPLAPITAPLGAVAGGIVGDWATRQFLKGAKDLTGSGQVAPIDQGAQAAPAAPTSTLDPETAPTQNQPTPAVAPAVAPVAPAAPAAPAVAPPSHITRVGNSYSGDNIGANAQIVNGQGAVRQAGGMISAQNNQAAENLARAGGQTSGFGPSGAIRGGGSVSSMDTSAGYAADLKQLASIDASKAEANTNMQGQADYAAMRAARIGPKAYQALQARNQADATTRAEQGIRAGALRDVNKLAQDRLTLDSNKAAVDATGAGFDNQLKGTQVDAAKQLQAAQQEYLNPANTPEQRAIAERKLVTLGGKQPAQDQFAYAPGGSIPDPVTGQLVPQAGVIFNKATGQKADADKPSIQTDPRAIAIRDDKNMTREQKIAALNKIGFK